MRQPPDTPLPAEAEVVPDASRIPPPVPRDDAGAGAREPLKRRIAVSLAVLVVLGAALAILQEDASTQESTSARETTRTALRALRANVATASFGRVAGQLRAERDSLASRSPRRDLGPAKASIPVGVLGPTLAAVRLEAAGETLRQGAMARTRVTWNTRSTQYTTVIALLAAALFFVGFALAVEGPPRHASYLLGMGVGVFAAGWAAWIHHLPVPQTPDRAITATALGTVRTEDGDYRGARAAYDRAIASDAGYGPAYAGRARARLLAANPDYPVTAAFTEVDGRASAAVIGDAVRALDLEGGRDTPALGLVALESFYSDPGSAAAARAVDDVLAVTPRVPDAWLLRSAAALAAGDTAKAQGALTRSLRELGALGAFPHARALAASALTYLAWVTGEDPRRGRAARRLADRVVAYETAMRLGPAGSAPRPFPGAVTVSALRFAEGRLTLRVRWEGLRATANLTALGYERPLKGGAWVQPAALALFAHVRGSGTRRLSIPLRRACLPTEVRVELFVDGARAQERTAPGVAATC